MKKILSLILTLFCVLSLVGCGRSMDDIIKNESSITGVVEEVYNNSILISIQTDAYPYGAYCDVSLDAENTAARRQKKKSRRTAAYQYVYLKRRLNFQSRRFSLDIQ